MNPNINTNMTRRETLSVLAATSLVGLAAPASGALPANVPSDSLVPANASALRELTSKLERAPRRRDFKTVPMILTRSDEWDSEALKLVLAYRGVRKQAFDNTELGGPWLNLMRNSINAQVWSWQHPDFLCVSATHGSAHLALFDDMIWDKYQIAKLTDGKFESNTLVKEPPAAASDPRDYQKGDGVFSPADNSIAVLQRRGVVFIACHNAIWEISAGRIKAGVNPDRLSPQAMAAEFTNHLIAGVVLSPGAIGTLPELQAAGFSYAK
jgi:hypothetical protein